MLCRFVGEKKYRKRIFLITDGEKKAKYSDRELADLTENIKGQNIKLNCITIDFCNELAEDDEDDEDTVQRAKPTDETQAQVSNKEFLMKL